LTGRHVIGYIEGATRKRRTNKMKHTTPEYIEIYYDRDYYICNKAATFEGCYIGTEEDLKAHYEAARHACIFEDEEEWPYDNYESWKSEMLYAWYDCITAWPFGEFDEINNYYYNADTAELKTVTELYLSWQGSRDVNNAYDTFAAMMNNARLYGFDIESKED
jgi:hypothetical protein